MFSIVPVVRDNPVVAKPVVHLGGSGVDVGLLSPICWSPSPVLRADRVPKECVLTEVYRKVLLTTAFLHARRAFVVSLTARAMHHEGCDQVMQLGRCGLVWDLGTGESVNVFWAAGGILLMQPQDHVGMRKPPEKIMTQVNHLLQRTQLTTHRFWNSMT